MTRSRSYSSPFAMGSALLIAAATAALTASSSPPPQAKSYALESADGLRPHNVVAAPATHQGRKGVRVTAKSPADPAAAEQLAIVDGLEFSNGVIEIELAGAPAPGAPAGARGFVGLAFRVQSDLRTYDAFYLRPTNGRADDQERRNHAAQYISHPEWTWARMRKETPSRYEAYVDLQPDAWTKIKIDVRGDRARLYVHDQEQPTLVVNDVKTGAQGRGAIALWLDVGTVAHFRNLTVRP